MSANPLCRTAALRIGTSCALSPEKLRATNVAPRVSARRTPSMADIVLGVPFLFFEPGSAEADRQRVAVPRDADEDEIPVGRVDARRHRRHAPVHAVEAVGLVQEIGR